MNARRCDSLVGERCHIGAHTLILQCTFGWLDTVLREPAGHAA
jgi:hypothetical protein